ncbi:MAG: hypothetical protein ABI851_08995 [Saprospiraceae bacterium]
MINIDQIISVSTKSSLFKAITSKSNGLILEDLSNGKHGFFSGRLYQFSPLDSMGLFTLSGTMPIKEVYEIFLTKESEMTIPSEVEKDDILKQFFASAIPEHDPYRVHVKDMKKCLRWYHQLKQLNLITID